MELKEWALFVTSVVLPTLGYIVGIRKSKYDADKSGSEAIESLRKNYVNFIEDNAKQYDVLRNQHQTLEKRYEVLLEKYKNLEHQNHQVLEKLKALTEKFQTLESQNKKLKSEIQLRK